MRQNENQLLGYQKKGKKQCSRSTCYIWPATPRMLSCARKLTDNLVGKNLVGKKFSQEKNLVGKKLSREKFSREKTQSGKIQSGKNWSGNKFGLGWAIFHFGRVTIHSGVSLSTFPLFYLIRGGSRFIPFCRLLIQPLFCWLIVDFY